MRWWWLVAALVACKGGDDDATGDGPDGTTPGDDDDDDVTFPGTCSSGGPDAPITEPVAGPEVAFTFEGFPAYAWVPPQARGLIVYFHGGATVDEIAQTEQAFLFSFLYREGFGSVATQRTLPGPDDQWDASPRLEGNEDAQRVARLLDQVRADHGLSADVPLVTSGFSDGGVMSMAFARIAVDEGWPIAANLVHNGAFANLGARVPTMLLVGENDNPQFPDRIAEDLAAEGVRAEVVWHPERPALPEAFLRQEGWDLAKGAEAAADVEALGLVDADGVRAVTDDQLLPALQLYGQTSTFVGATLTEARMRVLWATHRFNAHDADAECRFLLDAL